MTRNLLTITFLFLSIISFAQGNSPFSQFGPGDFYKSTFQSNFSKGGIAASSISPTTLNPSNPASYAQLKYTTGETGIYSSVNFINSNAGNDYFSNTDLSGFGLGFPLGKKTGLAFGLAPISKQNYSFSYDDVLSDASQVNYTYEGEGSLSKVFLGLGTQKGNLSVGINGQFVFGRLNDISKVIYNSSDYKNIRFQEYNNVSGFGLNIGAQFKFDLDAQHYLNIGGTYELGSNYNTSNYLIANYFTVGEATTSNNKIVDAEFHETTDFPIDTRDNPSEGKITLPSSLQFGVSAGKPEKWEASLEYKNVALSEYALNESSSNFVNSNQIIIGGTFIPNNKALGRSNYWKNISYNLGAFAGNTGIIALGEELNEFGINFGFGLPLKKFKYQTETFGSSVYLSFGYLNRSNNNLGISENMLNINASVVINDKWFIKRKFQ